MKKRQMMKKSIFILTILALCVFSGHVADNITIKEQSGSYKQLNAPEALNIKQIGPEKYAFKSLSGEVIEIGTERHSPPQPYLKLNKWNGEVSLKVDIPYVKNGQGSFIDNRLNWTSHKYEVDFYPKQPEEVADQIAGQKHTFTINEEGGVEFDVILKEKPESNIFEFPIETKGLKFYYQPPLHPEHPTWVDKDGDGKADSIRPENVVGSYAIYHETQDKFLKNKEEADKYKTGKAFHIYRPRIKDSSGEEIWGELNVDEEASILKITIDKNWLNNAVYPVTIDPNFGYTTIGGSNFYAWADELDGYTFTSPPNAESANSISIYNGDTSGGNFKGVIVLRSSLNIIANGVGNAAAVSASAGWSTSTFASPPALSPSTGYALMFINDFTGYPAWDSGAANQEVYDDSNSYSSPTNPTDAGFYDYKMSIYCTYTSSAANVFTDDVGIGTSDPDAKLHLTQGTFLQTISSDPTLEGSLEHNTWLNEAHALYVSGDYAYVVGGDGRFAVVNVSNPALPTLEGYFGSFSDSWDIKVAGKYAYVPAFGSNRLRIVDVSNPSSPTLLSSIQHNTYLDGAWDVYISGKYAYVAVRDTDYLTVVDISNAASPSITGYFTHADLNGATGVYVVGEYAYVSTYYGKLVAVDISDPASPSYVGTGTYNTSSKESHVSVLGKYAYVIEGETDTLNIFDISDPSSPTELGDCTFTSDAEWCYSVYVSGKYAFVTGANTDSLVVIDVADPADPSLVGVYESATNLPVATDVFVSGKYAYVACLGDRLTVLDLTGIDAPGANIGDISSSSIEVTDNVDIGNNLYVRSGLNVGPGGILSNGPLSAGGGGYFGDKVGIGAIDPAYDLTVDGNLGILEGGGSPSDYTVFQGATQSTDITYTLPTDDGDSGEALVTDGSGVLSWSVVDGLPSGTSGQTLRYGASDWEASSLLFNDGTGIGIGDTSPEANMLLTVGDDDLFQVNSSGELALSVDTATTAITATQAGAGDILNLNNGSTEVFTIWSSGRVGIGTDNPASPRLDIGGGSTGRSGGDWVLIAGDLEVDDDLQLDGGVIMTQYAATAWDLADSQTEALNIESGLLNLDTDNSRVGIGTSDPDAKLHLTQGTFLQTISTDPTHKGAITDGGAMELAGAVSIFVSGKYAYVAGYNDNGVEILDISDPANPSHVGSITDDATTVLVGAHSIFVSGKYAYVASRDENGVEILDISDPANPSHVGSITDDATTVLDGARSIYVSGRYAYVTAFDEDGVEILDISDPANPSHVGSITDAGAMELDGARSIFVSGKYAYVAGALDNGVEILDISDPANPSHVGSITDDATTVLAYPSSIYVSGRYAYVTSYNENGVEILDISDPANPSHVGSITDAGVMELEQPRSIYVSGRYAYVGSEGDDGVEILDISDPANPSHVGSITDDATTELDGVGCIFVSGKYAYVAGDADNGVEILDISGIDSPGANIGDISSSSIEVTDNVDIGNNLYVRSGLNVGPGGILSDGPLSAGGVSYFGDNVGIGTIDPSQALTIEGDLGILEGGSSPQYHSIIQGGDQADDITYTLPTDDGDSGEVLVTDGSGVLSWDTISGGPSGSAGQTLRYGSAWEVSDLLFNNGTGIGIGDTSPAALLTVGDGDLFQVNSSGAIAAATGITSSGTITFSGLTTSGPVTVASGVLSSEAQLATSRGGTGQDFSSTPQGDILYFSDTGVMSSLTYGDSDLFLKTLGAGANPAWDAPNKTGPTMIVAASNSKDTTRADYVCDGTSDEEQIENAIQDLETTGGTILLLEGTYNISSTINIAASDTTALSNISLVGSGNSTKLFLTNSANCDLIQIGDGGTTTVTGVVIANLQIDGNRANNTSGNGIYFNQDVHQSRVQNTWIHDCDDDGILLYGDPDGCTYNLIQGNDIRNNDSACIGDQYSEYAIISHNVIYGTNTGISALYCVNDLIANNDISGTTNTGVYIQGGGFRSTVIGNNFHDNTQEGFTMTAGDTCIITGNTFYNNGTGTTDSIYISNAADNTIISFNKIYDSDGTGYAIHVSDASNPVDGTYIIGNDISGGGYTAEIHIGTNATNTTIQQRNEFEVDGTLKAAQFLTEAQDTGVTLTTADFGKTITVDSGSAQVVNLPSVDSTNVGAWFRVIKLGAGQITIDAADSDTIADSSAGGTVVNSQSDQDYATIMIELVTETEWVIVDAHGTWTTS
ncbi:right-handed parallel beta-helix repeat-containing protein [Candidatus Omnitrophota bacterium]